MEPTHTIGFVWPGPPVPGDAEEVARFIPGGVDWHIVGTPRDFATDDRPAITRDRLFAMAENPNIEVTAAELPALGVQAIGYGCTSASYVRGVGGDTDIAARITEAIGLPLDNNLDNGSRGAQAARRHPRGRPLAARR